MKKWGFKMEEIDIIYTGLSELDELDQSKVKDVVLKHLDKIKNLVKSIESVNIHIKQYNKEGHTSKYSIHTKLFTPGKVFEVEKSEWDLVKVFHQTFIALHNEIEHYVNSR